MDITREELEELVRNLLAGIRQVSSPSSIRKVILEVKSLDEMISNRAIIGELAMRLDGLLEYPVFVREKKENKLEDGEYVIELEAYVGGRFVFGKPS